MKVMKVAVWTNGSRPFIIIILLYSTPLSVKSQICGIIIGTTSMHPEVIAFLRATTQALTFVIVLASCRECAPVPVLRAYGGRGRAPAMPVGARRVHHCRWQGAYPPLPARTGRRHASRAQRKGDTCGRVVGRCRRASVTALACDWSGGGGGTASAELLLAVTVAHLVAEAEYRGSWY